MNIDKSPSCMSNIRRVKGNSCFNKQINRPKLLFDKTTDTEGEYYDGKKEFTMKKLTSGIPAMEKGLDRHLTPQNTLK